MNLYRNTQKGKHFYSFELLDPNGQKIGGFKQCRLSNDIEKAQCFILASKIVQKKLNIKRHEFKIIHELFKEKSDS